MADAILTLEFAPGSPFRKVIEAEEALLGLATTVTGEVTESRRSLTWTLETASLDTTIKLRISPQLANEDVSQTAPLQVVDAVVDGVAMLGMSDDRPAFFSDDVLDHMEELVKLRSDLNALSIRNGVRGTLIDDAVQQNVYRLISPAYDEVGSVEGRLDGLIVHRDNRYFNVYDFLTNRRIRCDFAHRIPVDDITNGIERRVIVYGVVHVKRDGEPARVTAQDLYVFPPDNELPSLDELRGILR